MEQRQDKGHKVIPKILDNNRRVFVDLIKQLAPKYEELSIATGYWDLPGTRLIIDELKHFKKVRFTHRPGNRLFRVINPIAQSRIIQTRIFISISNGWFRILF
jgi:hypothetical protein